MVYAHYGLEVLEEICKSKSIHLDSNSLRGLFVYVYDTFVEEMDAIDNGIPMYPEGKPLYRINTNLSSRVGRMNPKWNTPIKSINHDVLFQKAMAYVGEEFVECIIEVDKFIIMMYNSELRWLNFLNFECVNNGYGMVFLPVKILI